MNFKRHVLLTSQEIGLGDFINNLQHIELIRLLLEEVKKTGREIYVGSNWTSSYIKLPKNVNPEYVLAWLLGKERPTKETEEETVETSSEQPGPQLANGKLPSNLLMITENYSQISAAKYLFGSHCNFEAIHILRKPWWIYPLATKWWVQNGFPKEMTDDF